MKLFIKNSVYKSHLLKTLVEWFQAVTNMLWPLRHTHPGAYLREGIVPCPPPFWATAQSKKVQTIR